jgi:hypothetical protein
MGGSAYLATEFEFITRIVSDVLTISEIMNYTSPIYLHHEGIDSREEGGVHQALLALRPVVGHARQLLLPPQTGPPVRRVVLDDSVHDLVHRRQCD